MLKHFDSEPSISVGICKSLAVDIAIDCNSVVNGVAIVDGEYTVLLDGDKIVVKDKLSQSLVVANSEIILKTIDGGTVEISNVKIGINFHWQQLENQRFEGDFKFVIQDNKIQVINVIPLEKYLKSVIGSEMNSKNHIELLKAHSVISRSWLIAQIYGKHYDYKTIITENENSVWYDRDAHIGFDVCADDHCQRYQGILRLTDDKTKSAVKSTEGLMLVYNDEICDARFSKCCGGISELFENCWQPVHYDYLEPVYDPYCDTNDKDLLAKVLNSYDLAEKNFYRWTQDINAKWLSDNIKQKTGDDLGEILELTPIDRGHSGRIVRLKIKGTKRTKIYGKELEIRRILSDTHLYSSAFDVEKIDNGFKLYGRGWGHGVGMCQIGAAVMAENGFTYDQILKHYYPKAELKKMY